MRPHHLVAGACAAAIFGAVTGAAIRTEPLERGVDAWDQIPHPDTESESRTKLSEPEMLPDHYPLVTPRGRFEVAELRDRGLYRNHRFGSGPHWIEDPEPAYDLASVDYQYLPIDDYEPGPVRTASEARAAAREALEAAPPPEEEPVVLAAAEEQPLAPPPLAEPPALAGEAGTIELPAELATRR